MIIYVDIDGVICHNSHMDYKNAVSIPENIKKINSLYDKGHKIVYWTARGTGSGKDWLEVTEKQFKDWGVRYHELRFGKPVYDLFIDDKATNPEDWDNLNIWNK